jgi:hypothetical protein
MSGRGRDNRSFGDNDPPENLVARQAETVVSVDGRAMRAPLRRVSPIRRGSRAHCSTSTRFCSAACGAGEELPPCFPPFAGRGGYRLPRDVSDRLSVALIPFKNREAAFALAAFLGRYHSNPDRVLAAFVIDRRALAGHPQLNLTEKRVRNAIVTLECQWDGSDRLTASPSRSTPNASHHCPRLPLRRGFPVALSPSPAEGLIGEPC